MNSMALSSTRLPLDHFVSGALIGAMTSFAIDSNRSKKNILKASIQSGLAASFAILASNNIANKNYTKAGISTLVGIGSLIATEQIFKENI